MQDTIEKSYIIGHGENTLNKEITALWAKTENGKGGKKINKKLNLKEGHGLLNTATRQQ